MYTGYKNAAFTGYPMWPYIHGFLQTYLKRRIQRLKKQSAFKRGAFGQQKMMNTPKHM